MSRLGQLRKKVHYDPDTPRCSRCVHYKPGKILLQDSLPREAPPLCAHHWFTVKPVGLCDDWRSKKDGTTLEV